MSDLRVERDAWLEGEAANRLELQARLKQTRGDDAAVRSRDPL